MPLAVRFDAVSTCSTGPNQSIQVKNAPFGRATGMRAHGIETIGTS